jgi:hypothetical protein
MNERIAWARAVFEAFRSGHEEHLGTDAYWWLPLVGEQVASEVGLALREAEIGSSGIPKRSERPGLP